MPRTGWMDGWMDGITWRKLFHLTSFLLLLFFPYVHFFAIRVLDYLRHPPPFFPLPFLHHLTTQYEMNGGVLGKLFVHPFIYLSYLTTYHYTTGKRVEGLDGDVRFF